MKEVQKRFNSLTEKTQKEKTTFLATNKTLQTKISKLESDIESHNSVFEHQKIAYLDRIKSLEQDLEIMENSIFQKDEDFDNLNKRLEEVLNLKENEISAIKSSLLSEIEKLKANQDVETGEIKNSLNVALEQVKLLQVQKLNAHKEHEKSLETLELANMSLQSTLEQYQAELESTTRMHSGDMKLKNETIENMKKQMLSAHDEIRLLQTNNQEMQSSIAVYAKDLEAKNHDLAVLKNEMDSSSVKNKILESNMVKIEQAKSSTIMALEQELKSSQNQIEQLEFEVQDLQQNRESIYNQNQTLDLQLKQTESAKSQEISALKTELADAHHKLDETCETLKTVKLKDAKLFSEYDNKIKNLGSAIENLEYTLSEEQKRMAELDRQHAATVQELETELEAVQAKSESEIKGLEDKVTTLNHSLRQSMMDNESISLKYQELQETYKSMEEYSGKETLTLNTKNNRLMNQLADKDQELEKLLGEIEGFKKTINSEKQARAEITKSQGLAQSDLLKKLEKSESENIAIKTQLDSALTNLKRADSNTKSLECDLDALVVSNQELNDQLVQAKSLNQFRSAQIEESKEELELAYAYVETLNAEIATISTDFDNERFKLDVMARDYEECISRLAQYDVLVQKLDNAEAEQSMNMELVDEFLDLKAENLRLTSQCADSIERCENEQNKNFELTMKVIQAGSTKKRFSTFILSQNQEMAKLENVIDELLSENHEMQVDLDECVEKIQMLEEQKQVLESQIQMSSADFEVASDELKLKAQKMIDLTNDIATLKTNLEKTESDLKYNREMVEDQSLLISKIEQELQKSKDNESSMKTQISEMTRKNSDHVQSLNADISDLHSRLETVTAESQAFSEQSADRLASIHNLQVQLETLQASKQDSDAKGQRLEEMIKNMNADLKTKANLCDQLERQLRDCEMDLKNVELSKASLEAELEVVVKSRNAFESKVAEQTQRIALLAENVESGKQEIQTLASNLEHTENRLSKEAELSNELKVQISQLESRYETETEKLNMDIKNKEQTISQDKEKINGLLQLDKLNQEALQQERESSRLAANKITSDFQTKLAKSSKEISELKENLEKMRNEYTDLQKKSSEEISVLNEERDVLLGEKSELLKNADDLSAELSKLNEQFEMSVSKSQTKIFELTQARDQLSITLKAKETDFETQKAELITTREELSKKSANLEDQVKIKSVELDSSIKLNQSLSKELESLREASKAKFDELKQQIQDLINKSGRDCAKYEQSIQDMTMRLAEKQEIILKTEENLKDAIVARNQEKGKSTNIVTSHVKTIEAMEKNVKEKDKRIIRLESELADIVQKHQDFQTKSQSSLEARARDLAKEAADEWRLEQIELQQLLTEKEAYEKQILQELDG